MAENPESQLLPRSLQPSTGSSFVLVFLFTLSSSLATYITSTYLHGSFNEATVGWLYAGGSAFGIAGLSLGYRAARRFGNARAFAGVVVLATLGAAAMALDGHAWLVALGFLFYFSTNMVGNFNIDLFLESATQNEHTGKVRGWSLTFENSAYLLGPLGAALLISDDGYWRVFLAAAGVLVVTGLYARARFREFRDPPYRSGGAWGALREILGRWNTRKALACFLVLQLYYAWIIIYGPIYLVDTIGFTVSQVALLTAIALVPFVMLQEWVGRLADCCTGEQEFLATGLAIMGLATLALPMISSHSFWVWAAALLVGRAGAAIVEAMTYSYLFKKIDGKDAGAMQLFHAIRPAATIAAPLLAAAILAVADLRALFAALGVICFAALSPALRLHDTR